MNNPRYPHRVRIYRTTMDLTTKDQNPVEVEVLNSVCRNYKDEKSYYRKSVLVSDYMLAIPVYNVTTDAQTAVTEAGKVLILTGDFVEVTHGNRLIKGRVVDALENNLGLNVWYNESK